MTKKINDTTKLGFLFKGATKTTGKETGTLFDIIRLRGGKPRAESKEGKAKLAKIKSDLAVERSGTSDKKSRSYKTARRSIERQTTLTAKEKRKPSEKQEASLDKIKKTTIKKKIKDIIKKKRIKITLKGKYKPGDYDVKGPMEHSVYVDSEGPTRKSISTDEFMSLFGKYGPDKDGNFAYIPDKDGKLEKNRELADLVFEKYWGGSVDDVEATLEEGYTLTVDVE
jgi:hypothetical protein